MKERCPQRQVLSRRVAKDSSDVSLSMAVYTFFLHPLALYVRTGGGALPLVHRCSSGHDGNKTLNLQRRQELPIEPSIQRS
jgi:hypothetical protein